jgi:hypothetical protein
VREFLSWIGVLGGGGDQRWGVAVEQMHKEMRRKDERWR